METHSKESVSEAAPGSESVSAAAAPPPNDLYGFTSQSAAATALQDLIVRHVELQNLGGTGASTRDVVAAIRQNLDANIFNLHNAQSAIVQAEGTYVAKNSAGMVVWTLRIVWDADNPPTGSTQTAHYGWEIYRNNARTAGPGHIFFVASVILPYYRFPDGRLVEDISLRANKSGKLGTGTLDTSRRYYRNA